MNLISLLALVACLTLAACSTPYSPPVVVKGSPKFIGLADLLSPERPLDVILVHGMCTHDAAWATGAMAQLATNMKANLAVREFDNKSKAGGPPGIELVPAQTMVAGSRLRMTGIVWSPLTAALKQQLLYDNTAEPTDCAADLSCKPKRASINGAAKDKLLNDCLSDAMAYQGASRDLIRSAMVDALEKVLQDSPPGSRIVLISDSLGSKISFDALAAILLSPKPSAVKKAAGRIGQIFMNANQLPMLGLADQKLVLQPAVAATEKSVPPVLPMDSLKLFISLRPKPALELKFHAAGGPDLAVIAFTDPNDLLSYRLLPSRYASPDVAVSDVLVSNQKTYLGLIERPDKAHTDYMANPDVATAIACGIPKSARCR